MFRVALCNKMRTAPIPTKIAPYIGPSCPDPAPGSGPPKKQKIPHAIIRLAIVQRKRERTFFRIKSIILHYLPYSMCGEP